MIKLLTLFLLVISSFAKGCNQDKIKRDVDFFNSDIRSIDQVEDAESCGKLCAQTPLCKSWTYVKAPTHAHFKICFLKHSDSISATSDTCCDSGLQDACSVLTCSYRSLGGLALEEGNLLTNGNQFGTLEDAKVNCEERGTCQSFAFCAGNGGAYFLYDKRMSSTERLSLRTDCTTYSKVCPVKSIGYWTFTAENRHADDQEITITKTFSGSKGAEEAKNELQSISNDIKQSHSAEVAVGVSASNGFVEASLEAKYGYEYEHAHNEAFESALAQTATKTYEQGLSFERTLTIPAIKLHEPNHVNIWVWTTEAIREDSLSKLAGSSYTYDNTFLMRWGCGYDIPPNCLPGKCDPHDINCWTCTDDQWKIDPDFEPPTFCDEEECSFIPIRTADCPNRLQLRELENCRTTQDMKEGEYCEATNNIAGFIEEHDINNCPGGRDIFRYSCALTASEECDFKETFTATGCPNNEIPLTIMQDWNDAHKFSSYDLVLKNMLSYCNDVKNGIATDAQKEVCCGKDIDCQAGLRCVKQPQMILCSRKSHCTVKQDVDYFGSDIRNIPQVADADDCAKLCSQESSCASWTYVKDITHKGFRTCHLKSRDDITATSSTCCDSGLQNACSSVSSTTSTN